MLYNINNNNYISVLDIQLWMMHCLLIYYRDHYACQNYWLQNCIFTCICLSCMLNPINLIIRINVNSKQVKDNMCNSFLDFWNGERVDAIGSNRGKLDTYFYIKTHFGKEKYLQINNFKIRQSICKIRVSVHRVLI
jgi:hypothetical protein